MAFHLSGTITIPTADLEAVRAALPEHAWLSRAERGCLSFEVEERAGGVFSVSESFQNADAFAAHQARIKGTAWERVTASAVRNYKTWSD